MALQSNGKIYVWGNNVDGVTNFGGNFALRVITNWTAIAAGDSFCLGLTQAGLVKSWGNIATGQTSGFSNVISIAAGNGFGTVLQSNGTILSWGTYLNPTNMPYALSIAAGFNNGMAVVNPTQAATAPTILSQPLAQTVGLGSTAFLRVGAVGYGTLSYQWYFNGTNAIANANGPFLYITNIQVQQIGQYSVSVSNTAGTTYSLPAFINALPSLTINLVPAISMIGGIGLAYQVQYINAVGPTNAVWNTLDTVTLTNNPQFYFDASAIGQPQRFYRVMLVQ